MPTAEVKAKKENLRRFRLKVDIPVLSVANDSTSAPVSFLKLPAFSTALNKGSCRQVGTRYQFVTFSPHVRPDLIYEAVAQWATGPDVTSRFPTLQHEILFPARPSVIL